MQSQDKADLEQMTQDIENTDTYLSAVAVVFVCVVLLNAVVSFYNALVTSSVCGAVTHGFIISVITFLAVGCLKIARDRSRLLDRIVDEHTQIH